MARLGPEGGIYQPLTEKQLQRIHRAIARGEKLLEEHEPSPLPADIDRAIRDRFSIL